MTAAARVLAELERRRPGYLPATWRAERGSGPALLTVLAHLAGLVEEGLEQIPDKYLLVFLDAMGVNLLPPAPARAPLVFTLASDAPVDVPLPEESEVAAVSAPPLPQTLDIGALPPPPPEPVLFATERSISLTRARLTCVYSIVPATDEYADHSTELTSGFAFFDGRRPIPHHLYLGHASLFDLKGPAEISLQIGVSQPRDPRQQTAPMKLRWEYLATGAWLGFEPVIDQTHGLTVDGEVLLRKICGPPLARGVVDGIESFWIRARVDQPLALPGSGGSTPLPRIDTLRVRVSLTHAGLPLDAAFNDGLRLDTTKDFLPFGAEPLPGSSFLIACDNAFKRDGAQIKILIQPSKDNHAVATQDRALTWEYSVGEGLWQEFLQGNQEQLELGAGPRELTFVRPSDWRAATVGGQARFWLRVRLSRGSYGRTTFGPGGVVTTPAPPLLARMTVAYAYSTGPEELHHVVTRNRFAFEDSTEAARWGREAFQPFQPVPDRAPAAYLGFDAPLPIGLVSLFADAGGGGSAPSSSPFIWEYRSAEGWSELPVKDETGGVRQAGMIQFVGQPDLVADAGPAERELFWVRARLKAATATPEPLPVTGLYLNAVWAANRGSVRREIAGRADGSAGQALALQHPPVLPEETIEVQEWRGTSREWESLFRDVPDSDLQFDRDGGDRVTAVWVRWQERAHLHDSGPQDRHYTLERTRGLLRFGDGQAGKLPPPGAAIAASYRYGGGPQGNVQVGAITQLHSAVPYVQAVTNPVTASGGAAAEPAAAVPPPLRYPLLTGEAPRPAAGVWARGPQRLRHRDRAVSSSDYEWIARDATPEVALARCYDASGPDGRGMPGWVTVAVAPWSKDPQPQPSAELLGRVRTYLSAAAPAAVVGRVRVVGPRYQPVSVTAEVVIRDPGRSAEIEEDLRAALAAFLHPLLGGVAGAGWGFGEPVRLSHVATVVQTAPGVEFASVLQLSSEGIVHGDSVPVEPDCLPASGRHLLKLALEG